VENVLQVGLVIEGGRLIVEKRKIKRVSESYLKDEKEENFINWENI
jgi:hypothetical protein